MTPGAPISVLSYAAMTSQSPSSGVPPFDLGSWLNGLADFPPVVQAGAAVLRGRARDVPPEVLGTEPFLKLLEIMVEVMRRAPGVGLAAPQIGIPWRLFVAEDQEERVSAMAEETREERGRVVLPLMAVINPVLTPASNEEVIFFEGCLSVRGYAALVARHTAVKLTGLDAHGRPLQVELEGWPARIMQHETDHLNGTLYVDRMLTRSLASEGELPRLGRLSVDEVLRELVLQPPSGS